MILHDGKDLTDTSKWLFSPKTAKAKVRNYYLEDTFPPSPFPPLPGHEVATVDISWNPKPGFYITNCPFNITKVAVAPCSHKDVHGKYIDVGTLIVFLGRKQRIPGFWSFFEILIGEEKYWLAIPERILPHKDAQRGSGWQIPANLLGIAAGSRLVTFYRCDILMPTSL